MENSYIFFLRCMYIIVYTYFMNHPLPDFAPQRKQWLDQLASAWPALKGSLARVKKPCIRKNCPACARGDKHPAWIFSFTDGQRRRCMYVPKELVPLFRQGLQQGRRLEKLLFALGPELLRAYRQQRDQAR